MTAALPARWQLDAVDEDVSCLPKKCGEAAQIAGVFCFLRLFAALHEAYERAVDKPPLRRAGSSRKSIIHSKVVAMRAFNGIMGALRRHREAPLETGAAGGLSAGTRPVGVNGEPIVSTQGFSAMDIEELGGRLREYEASQGSVKGWGRLRGAVVVGSSGGAHSMLLAPAHAVRQQAQQPASLSSQVMGLDEELAKREEVGTPVLENLSTLDTEWNLPDLARIFRPPESIIRSMSVGISPGQWVKLVPESVSKAQDSKWGTLRSAMQTGIAFKVQAREGEMASEEEAAARRRQAQMDVEAFKHFLLNITRAWDELMATEESEHNPWQPDDNAAGAPMSGGGDNAAAALAPVARHDCLLSGGTFSPIASEEVAAHLRAAAAGAALEASAAGAALEASSSSSAPNGGVDQKWCSGNGSKRRLPAGDGVAQGHATAAAAFAAAPSANARGVDVSAVDVALLKNISREPFVVKAIATVRCRVRERERER